MNSQNNNKGQALSQLQTENITLITDEQDSDSSEENLIDSVNLQKQLSKRLATYYPLPSIVVSLVAIALLIVIATPTLAHYYQVPELLKQLPAKFLIFTIVAVTIAIDIRIFQLRKQNAIKQFQQNQNYLEKVLESKKIQQQKANTYSGHAEKLKMFISDRLLEYIEYDEKFIHFKGIASEIRHNGVISYDKVITALEKAIEQQQYLAIYEQSNESENEENSTPSEQTLNATAKYQNAIDAMRYLWSLLDLSTADNITLHIGNQLIECEEHYYQLNLDSEAALESTQSIPLSPTFHPQAAALMTLSFFEDIADIRNTLSLAKINDSVYKEPFYLETSAFRITLQPVLELLGNPNHIILLLENLIKNAQFFSQKAKPKQQSDRISLTLKPGEHFVEFNVYNRGPLIEGDIDELFKLGYSTRKSHKHHGKGLGLFFTQEIVNGYQGKIEVINIANEPKILNLKLTLASGEQKEFELQTHFNQDGLRIKSNLIGELTNQFEYEGDIPVIEIQVLTEGEDEIASISHIDQEQELNLLDTSNEWFPQWKIKLRKFRKSHKLTFLPLDVQGVLFKVKLPTADSRLNDVEPELDT